MNKNTEDQETFKQWCIVEIMGRQVIAGLVTEQVIAGTPMLRVDVPESDGIPAFTRFYGGSAIYAITPVSEDVVSLTNRRHRPEPVNVYVPELKQLAAQSDTSHRVIEADYLDDEDDPVLDNDDDDICPPF